MPYKANKGGHAPGHLREAFLQYIEEGSESDIITPEDEERPISVRWLIGQLWDWTTFCLATTAATWT